MTTATTSMTVNHALAPVADPRTDISTDELARSLCVAAVLAGAQGMAWEEQASDYLTGLYDAARVAAV